MMELKIAMKTYVFTPTPNPPRDPPFFFVHYIIWLGSPVPSLPPRASFPFLFNLGLFTRS